MWALNNPSNQYAKITTAVNKPTLNVGNKFSIKTFRNI